MTFLLMLKSIVISYFFGHLAYSASCRLTLLHVVELNFTKSEEVSEQKLKFCPGLVKKFLLNILQI